MKLPQITLASLVLITGLLPAAIYVLVQAANQDNPDRAVAWIVIVASLCAAVAVIRQVLAIRPPASVIFLLLAIICALIAIALGTISR